MLQGFSAVTVENKIIIVQQPSEEDLSIVHWPNLGG
jgi:hypothetical protein